MRAITLIAFIIFITTSPVIGQQLFQTCADTVRTSNPAFCNYDTGEKAQRALNKKDTLFVNDHLIVDEDLEVGYLQIQDFSYPWGNAGLELQTGKLSVNKFFWREGTEKAPQSHGGVQEGTLVMVGDSAEIWWMESVAIRVPRLIIEGNVKLYENDVFGGDVGYCFQTYDLIVTGQLNLSGNCILVLETTNIHTDAAVVDTGISGFIQGSVRPPSSQDNNGGTGVNIHLGIDFASSWFSGAWVKLYPKATAVVEGYSLKPFTWKVDEPGPTRSIGFPIIEEGFTAFWSIDQINWNKLSSEYTHGGKTWFSYPQHLIKEEVLWVIGTPVSSTAVDEELTTSFSLGQNYPNPFNQATTISYEILTAAEVRLTVYDLLGREVVTLVDALQSAGHHEVTWQVDNLPSGTYLARLQTPSGVRTTTMVLSQ